MMVQALLGSIIINGAKRSESRAGAKILGAAGKLLFVYMFAVHH